MKLRAGNLVVDDEMTETRYRNGANNGVIHIPNEAMFVDEQQGIPILVGFLGQSDRITSSKDSLKPLFCDMLTGKVGGTQHTNFIIELDVELGESDVRIDKDGSLPEICFSSRVHRAIDAKLSKSLVVQLLGKSICYCALFSCVQALWNFSGEMHLIDLDNQGRFAIMVNLGDPLVPGIMIDGNNQIIEYKGLPLIFYGCGKYGHLKEACGQSQMVEVVVLSQRHDPKSSSELYEPWKQVVNRQRCGSVVIPSNEPSRIPNYDM
ncbi:hypothetical protein GQ457_01G018220 [Hibiscus cannabinus]